MKVVTTSGHRRHSSTQPKLAPWLFLFPALLLFVFIFVLPIAYTIMQSFLKPGQKKLLYAPQRAHRAAVRRNLPVHSSLSGFPLSAVNRASIAHRRGPGTAHAAVFSVSGIIAGRP